MGDLNIPFAIYSIMILATDMLIPCVNLYMCYLYMTPQIDIVFETYKHQWPRL